jgi:hypothetical protein
MSDWLLTERIAIVRSEWEQFNERERELARKLLVEGKHQAGHLREFVDGARLSPDLQRLQDSRLIDYSIALLTWGIKPEYAEALAVVLEENS